MKPIIRSILISFTVLLFILSPAPCRAENDPVEHIFDNMFGRSEIQFTDSYHTAKTSLVTYSCSDGAVFWVDLFNAFGNQKIAINFSAKEQVVTTTAIENLAGIEISYFYQRTPKEQIPHISVTLSYDSIYWPSPIVTDGMYTTPGLISTSFIPGKYYVRLTNTNSNSASIYQITYYFLDPLSGCPNCFIYRPE